MRESVAIDERRKAATRSLVSREFSMILLFGAVFVSGVVRPGQVVEVEEGGRMWKERKMRDVVGRIVLPQPHANARFE